MIRAGIQPIRTLTPPARVFGCALFGFALIGLIGCTSLGPARVHSDRFDYNKAGARSANEQILLNIIRLRYREPIYFVEVNSMLSQYTFQANANYQTWWNDLNIWPNPLVRAGGNVDGDPSEQTQIGGNIGYTDRPTITYAPLQGKDFAQRVLSPIPAPTIIYLSQSGWDIDQLLECCVQRLNDVRNTPIHDVREGDMWDTVTFEQVAKLLKQMQDAGKLNLTVEIDPDNNISYLSVPAVTDENKAAAEQLSQLLDLEEGIQRIRLIEAGVRYDKNELIMQTRSMMGVMNALAQTVYPPDEHIRDGQVLVIADPNKPRPALPWLNFKPTRQPKRWLNVEHSRVPQRNAFVQVFYNGYWWYIRQSDWMSKGTFSLLSYLFQLQATEGAFQTPLVTVPASN